LKLKSEIRQRLRERYQRPSTEVLTVDEAKALEIIDFYNNCKSKIKTENKFKIGEIALDLILAGSNVLGVKSYRKNLY
jgi:hypothetical protein